jgi:hypothetical protein
MLQHAPPRAAHEAGAHRERRGGKYKSRPGNVNSRKIEARKVRLATHAR